MLSVLYLSPLSFSSASLPGHLPADNRLVRLDDLPHPRFDPGKIVRANRLIEVDVVVEPILHRRPVHQLGLGPEAANRLRHDVRTAMAHDVQAFFVLGRDNLHARTVRNGRRQIDQLAVDLGGHRGFRQTRANLLRHLLGGAAIRDFQCTAVRKCDLCHTSFQYRIFFCVFPNIPDLSLLSSIVRIRGGASGDIPLART